MTEPIPTPAELMRANNGLPWCDTCKGPAVFSEHRGILHRSKDFPFGIPAHLDPDNTHEVTMREWWNTPTLGWGG